MRYARDVADAGELLRRVRQRRGLSQRILAQRSGTQQSAISRIERGEETPTVARLEQLLRAMGEQLVVKSEPLDLWCDPSDLAAERELSRSERLREGVRLASVATSLWGKGRR